MKKLLTLLYILLFLLVVGCQMNGIPTLDAAESLVTTTEMPIPIVLTTRPTDTATSPETPSTTPQVTATLAKTATPTATFTPAIPPEARLQFQCLEIAPTLPANLVSNGVVILDNWGVADGLFPRDDFKLEMARGELIQINQEDEYGLRYAVSPDRKLLAYHRFTHDAADNIIQDDLVVATADGQQLNVIPWEEGWVDFPGWLNNQQLAINIAGLDPLESTGKKADSFLVLNPFTGERKILRPDFPNIYSTPPIYDWGEWSITMYDPTLTRVVYLTELNDFTFALWDIENGRGLANLQAIIHSGFYLPTPRWAPDGSRFVVEAFIASQHTFELFLVSRDGEIEQLTNLYQYEKAHLASTSWSPNGRFIAAWLDLPSLEEKKEVELVLIDTTTQQITDYCLRIKYGGEGYSEPLPMVIWSPDGTQLLVRERYELDHRRVFLVDLVRGFVAPIVEDMEPMGWMLAP